MYIYIYIYYVYMRSKPCKVSFLKVSYLLWSISIHELRQAKVLFNFGPE